MTWKILRLFVNTLTAVDKYSLLYGGNLTQDIQMYLFQKQKNFSEFFSGFFKSTLNFGRFPKKVILIAYEFPTLRTSKYVVR